MEQTGAVAYPAAGSQWPPSTGSGPSDRGSRAHRWFVVYAIAMVVLYLLVIVAGVVLLLFDFDLSSSDVDQLRIQGIALALVGVVMLGVFAVGPFLPRKPWGWTYGLVLIGVGMTSCCTWPATIPLMIQWLKPETKAHFGTR